MQPSHVERVFKCQIYTDSRGTGLNDYIGGPQWNTAAGPSNAKSKIITTIHVRKGAKLEQAQKFLIDTNAEQNKDLIILAVGICNLTERIRDNHANTLVYRNRGRKQLVIDIIQQLLHMYGNKIHIATITPACLLSYYRAHNNTEPSKTLHETLEIQQANLLEDCQEINTLIINSNIARDQPTLPWAKQSYTESKKRKKSGKPRGKVKCSFNPRNLPDGVHPNNTLRQTWFKLLKNFVDRVAKKLLPPDNPESDNTESSDPLDLLDTTQSTEDEEEINFKRRKKQKLH